MTLWLFGLKELADGGEQCPKNARCPRRLFAAGDTVAA
jgi:hypothetical protein